MKLLSGGQSGVDRAVLDVAVARGIDYGGWCPKGGWAEDLPAAARRAGEISALEGNAARRSGAAHRMERARCRRLHDRGRAGGVDVSNGTALAQELAHRYRKPLLIVEPCRAGSGGAVDALAALAAAPGRRRSRACHRRSARERGARNLCAQRRTFLHALISAQSNRNRFAAARYNDLHESVWPYREPALNERYAVRCRPSHLRSPACQNCSSPLRPSRCLDSAACWLGRGA